MKILGVKDYLIYRMKVLNHEYIELNKQYESNQMAVAEIRKKIEEMKSSVDEGFEMFSPIAAEGNTFNKQEIKNLQVRAYMYIDDNKKLSDDIDNKKNEMNIIKKLLNDEGHMNAVLEEMIDKNVWDEEAAEDLEENELLKRLEYCSDNLVGNPLLVRIELEALIRDLKRNGDKI